MFEHQLGQSLLLHPSVSFEQIDRTLHKFGWHTTQSSSAAKPLLAGEPEHRTWTWRGGKPFVVYTFNPVAKLRVLDVATLPPRKRGELARALPMLGDDEIGDCFSAADPRRRLLALWAAKECERLDLAGEVRKLCGDTEPVVREQSETIAKHLSHIADQRVQVLGSLQLVAQAAGKVLRQLNERPELLPALMPSQDDCRHLFDERYADAIHAAAKKVYASLSSPKPGEMYHHLETTAAYAGLLRWPNELSEKFPRGYRDIAGWLQPHVIWLTWAWVEPLPKEKLKPFAGSRSPHRIRYDGLAWVKDHWVWLPKAHRLLADQVAGDCQFSTSLH